MTIFNLKELNPGAWFVYEEDKKCKPLSRVKIRAYNNEILKQISDKHTKEVVEYKQAGKRGNLQRITYLKSDEEAVQGDLWDYSILEWEGFQDESKTDIPCTRENKILLMRQNPQFYAFIDKCIGKLLPDTNEEVEEAEKN